MITWNFGRKLGLSQQHKDKCCIFSDCNIWYQKKPCLLTWDDFWLRGSWGNVIEKCNKNMVSFFSVISFFLNVYWLKLVQILTLFRQDKQRSYVSVIKKNFWICQFMISGGQQLLLLWMLSTALQKIRLVSLKSITWFHFILSVVMLAMLTNVFNVMSL